MKPYLTDTQIEKLLKTAIVLVDTREQENQHILEWLDKKKIAYIVKKLDFGDYGIMLPKNDDLNFPQNMVLDFAVERKGSLNEYVGNIAQERTRLENEFIRGHKNIRLLIENATIEDIYTGNYRSNINLKSLIGSYNAFNERYDLQPTFCIKSRTAQIIYDKLYYRLKNELRGK